MKTMLVRIALLLALAIAQQGAFALAYASDIDPARHHVHDSGGPCDDCRYLTGASGALVPYVASPLSPVFAERPAAREADVAVQAVSAAYHSRAPPSLSL
jgi:hypothetical protein